MTARGRWNPVGWLLFGVGGCVLLLGAMIWQAGRWLLGMVDNSGDPR